MKSGRSFVERLKRNILFLLYCGLGKHLPCSYARWGGRYSKKIRYYLCHSLLDRCGQNVNIETGAYFGRGDGVEIGDNSDIGINCQIWGAVEIGSDTIMGPDVFMIVGNHGYQDQSVPIRLQESPPGKKIVIGNDVWLGARVMILDGVHIGDHAIIGAGSVVTKSIPEWAIAVGNPAVVKKFRSKTTAEIDEN